MPFKVLKSQIPDDFAARVAAFRQAKIDHQKTTDVPAPREHDLVEQCLRRVARGVAPDEWVIDYEVEDDTPPPPTLKQKKDNLARKVTETEHEALNAIMPPGHRRLLQFQFAEAAAKEKDKRSDDEHAAIERHNKIRKDSMAISRHAAELHAEIDDLTDATIEQWQPRPFSPL